MKTAVPILSNAFVTPLPFVLLEKRNKWLFIWLYFCSIFKTGFKSFLFDKLEPHKGTIKGQRSQLGLDFKKWLDDTLMSKTSTKSPKLRLAVVKFHTIRKVKFLSKNSILTKPQHFHEFFTQIFCWQFFLWNQSCQQLTSPKPQHFHPKIFSGKQSWIFEQKM